MKVNEKILDKVRKLLTKANDPSITQEEMESFMAAAQRLSIKHGIDSTHIELNVTDISKEYIEANRGKKEDKSYEGRLFSTIARAFNCKIIFLTNRRKTVGYEIIGTAENRSMAIEMFKICLDKFRSYAWPRYKEYQKEGVEKWRKKLNDPKIGAYALIDQCYMINSETFIPSYLNGTIAGLRQRFEEEKAAELNSDEAKEKWGLIAINHDTLINEYQAKVYKNLGTYNSEKIKTANEGFRKGLDDGRAQTNKLELK